MGLLSVGRPGRDAETRREGGGGDADSHSWPAAEAGALGAGGRAPGGSLGRGLAQTRLGVWPEGCPQGLSAPWLRAQSPEAWQTGVCCLDAWVLLHAVSPSYACMLGLVISKHPCKHKTRSLIFYSTLRKKPTRDLKENISNVIKITGFFFFIELSLEYK